ncbi:MAG: hypothetical protein KF799_10800 [Bdellovibrionales bacterium]|nr:hypothetical protein [Bdellovibrionales bacterium]
MWRTLLALALLLSSATEARELALKQRFDHRFNTSGWQVFVHRSKGSERLVALNKNTLQVEVINPANDETLSQDNLDSKARNLTLIETLSTSTGEFVIAFANADGRVEMHSLDSEVSFELEETTEVLALSLIERKGGEVFMAVTTRTATEVYHRTRNQLTVIQRIASRSGVQSGKLLRSGDGEVLLQVLNGDRKMHLLHIDAEAKDSSEVLVRRSAGRKAEGVLSEGSDFLMAMTDGRYLRFYIDSQKTESKTVKADINLGTAGWLRGADGRWLFSAVHSENEATRLTLYDPYSLDKPIRLGVANAQNISHVGAMRYAGQPLYYFVKDSITLVLQNAETLQVIPNRKGDRILSVQPVYSQRALAITLEGKNGTRLLLVGLN